MLKTADFQAFLSLYGAVTHSSELTLAEKTAAIECAFDEYSQRVQPAAYREIAKRLAKLPPREHAPEPRHPDHVPADKPAAPASARSPKGTFLPRSRR